MSKYPAGNGANAVADTKVPLSASAIPTIEAYTDQAMAETNAADAAEANAATATASGAPSGPNGTKVPGDDRTRTSSTSPAKSLKLISVSFKEAALDSPTFRAYVRYSTLQIDAFQKWLDTLISHQNGKAARHKMFETFFAETESLFESAQLTEGFVDSDYTIADVNFTAATYKEIATELLKFTVPNPEMTRNLTELSQKQFAEFAEMRRNFETVQNRYDLVLARYGALPKSREPASLQEDAVQLAEIRNQYISVSLDMATAITDITEAINSSLIRTMSSFWRWNFDLQLQTKNLHSFKKYAQRIDEFLRNSTASIDNLRSDMMRSKELTIESTLKLHAPSRDVDDYNCAAINPSTLLDGYVLAAPENHGWLFMKTASGKPPREVWIRRWCFVKNGIFGMLCLSPTKTFVQETDKIGVALCNIRYCPEESRRYCFEIKTIYNRIVLQAETLGELKNWLSVVETAKANVMSSGDELGLHRYPPLIQEFACSLANTADADLTTTDDSQSLNHLLQSSQPLSLETGFLSTIYNAPICTALSPEAVAAHAFVSPTTIPTAITANIWGSVNWGNYYLANTRQQFSAAAKEKQQIIPESSIASRYPSFYPKRLKVFDAQLRSLLGPAMGSDDLVLLAFRGIWMLNTKQELVGRCYMTASCLYFYMNSFGFVSIVSRDLKEITAFDYTTYDNYDVLKIHEISGLSLKAKLFLDSGKLIKDQLTAILKNNLRETPKSIGVLLKDLEDLRNVHAKQEIERLKANYVTRKEIIPSVISTSMKLEEPIQIKINYNQEMKLLWDKVYDLPSKALFHFLLGDQSFILQKILPFIDARNENISMTLWNPNAKGELSRTFMTDTILNDYDFHTTRVNQKIENLINSKYYNVLQQTQFFKSPGCPAYRIYTRIVIYSLNLKNSKLLVYSKVEFEKPKQWSAVNYMRFVVAHFMTKVTRLKIEVLDRDIAEAIENIGPHAKVVKAIRLYGQITKDESPKAVPDNSEVMYLGYVDYMKMVTARILWALLELAKLVFRLLQKFVTSVKLNYILVLLLGLSVGYNLMLSKRSATSYWAVRSADQMVRKFAQDDSAMSRSIYLKDVQELVESKYAPRGHAAGDADAAADAAAAPESRCYANYRANSVLLNNDIDFDNELQKTYRELGLKRNQLMVSLKMINSLEAYLVDAEWNNFVANELQRCDAVFGLDMAEQNLSALSDYCRSCRADLDAHAADPAHGLI